MCCEHFDQGQGQTRIDKLKSAYNSFIIDPRGLQCETNLQDIVGWESSDLTFGPSFKVKRWFTGFGELSFQWIQICIGSPMRRSSYGCSYVTTIHLLDMSYTLLANIFSSNQFKLYR